MKKLRKLLALTTAFALTLSMASTALAEETTSGGGTATGELEGTVSTDVYSAVIPTSVAITFAADPEGLIEATKGDALGENDTYESGATVFFANAVAGSTQQKTKEITVDEEKTVQAPLWKDEGDDEYFEHEGKYYAVADTTMTSPIEVSTEDLTKVIDESSGEQKTMDITVVEEKTVQAPLWADEDNNEYFEHEGKYYAVFDKEMSSAVDVEGEDLVLTEVTETTGNYVDYKSTSPDVTIVNKSSYALDVTVKATVTGVDNITMAATGEGIGEATNATLYLALKSGDTTVALTSAAEGVTLAGVVAAVAEEKWEYVYEDGTYKYQLDNTVTDEDYGKYTFCLTGAAGGDWSELTEATPSVALTWSVAKEGTETTEPEEPGESEEPEEEGDVEPSLVTDAEIALEGTEEGLTIEIDFGSGELAATEITKVTYKNSNGSTNNAVTKGYAEISENTVVLTKGLTDAVYGKGTSNTTVITITVALKDGTTTTFTVNLTAAASEG